MDTGTGSHGKQDQGHEAKVNGAATVHDGTVAAHDGDGTVAAHDGNEAVDPICSHGDKPRNLTRLWPTTRRSFLCKLSASFWFPSLFFAEKVHDRVVSDAAPA